MSDRFDDKAGEILGDEHTYAINDRDADAAHGAFAFAHATPALASALRAAHSEGQREAGVALAAAQAEAEELRERLRTVADRLERVMGPAPWPPDHTAQILAMAALSLESPGSRAALQVVMRKVVEACADKLVVPIFIGGEEAVQDSPAGTKLRALAADVQVLDQMIGGGP